MQVINLVQGEIARYRAGQNIAAANRSTDSHGIAVRKTKLLLLLYYWLTFDAFHQGRKQTRQKKRKKKPNRPPSLKCSWV